MSLDDEEFVRQLRSTFKLEAGEHVQAISSGLLELERTPGREAVAAIVEAVFRAVHSLKGAARAVDYAQIESLCQSLEDVFASWRRRPVTPSAEALDTLHAALDAINATLADPAGTPVDQSSLRQALRELLAPAAPSPAAPAVAAIPERPPEQALRAEAASGAPAAAPTLAAGDTVRIPVAKLEARLLDAEEMLAAKLSAGERVIDLRGLAGRLETWRKAWAAIEPEVHALGGAAAARSGEGHSPPGLARVLEFFEASLETLKSIESQAAALGRGAGRDHDAFGRLVDELLEESKRLLLLPFGTISASFPKLVRDLCRDEGKEADLGIHGEDIAVDKRILEEMKDPLVHLLRNCIDHGIEPPAERARKGKFPRATISLSVKQLDGSKVELVVADDGAGIDTAKVKASAIRHGRISAEAAGRLDERGAQELVFLPEVSTSPMITRLSGRGLGLAIVREKAEKLGGAATVESRPGAGTAFRIVVPATRATFRGILVEAAGRLLVIPTTQVERVTRVRAADVETVEARETIAYAGHAVPLVDLADALELPRAPRPPMPAGGVPVVILGGGDQAIAFSVDAVIDEQEVLVKALRKPLSRVRNVAGATILGAGRIAPILNVADLLKSARKVAGARAPIATAAAAPPPRKAATILVAEDSITSRMLLKAILESAGYRVKIAVDGLEAFTLLRSEPVDLVVSDVEMPRLNGFDLTARIRADRKLADLPVVLVTALETREDRERGIDVGANAYIAKGSFDQASLVEAIRRLV